MEPLKIGSEILPAGAEASKLRCWRPQNSGSRNIAAYYGEMQSRMQLKAGYKFSVKAFRESSVTSQEEIFVLSCKVFQENLTWRSGLPHWVSTWPAVLL